MATTNYNRLYAKWDAAMAVEKPGYERIFGEMLEHVGNFAHCTELQPSDAGFWWRMSKATFGVSLDYDIDSQQSFIDEKTTAAVIYADKAIAADPTCFEAYLAKARALDRSAFLACSSEMKVNCIEQLIKSVIMCYGYNNLEQAKTEPLIIFLQTNIVSLLYSTEDEAELVRLLAKNETTNKLLPFQPEALEVSLRQSVEQMPNCFEAYLALVALLNKREKYQDARQMVAKALTIPKLTQWDQCIASMLELVRNHLENL